LPWQKANQWSTNNIVNTTNIYLFIYSPFHT
jgi:hypothetical protein